MPSTMRLASSLSFRLSRIDADRSIANAVSASQWWCAMRMPLACSMTGLVRSVARRSSSSQSAAESSVCSHSTGHWGDIDDFSSPAGARSCPSPTTGEDLVLGDRLAEPALELLHEQEEAQRQQRPGEGEVRHRSS